MRVLQKRMMREYRRIADKFGVTQEQVQEIEAFQWKFVRDNIAKGKDDVDTFENIYLRFLGTFHVSRPILEHIKRSKERSKKKKDAKNTRDI